MTTLQGINWHSLNERLIIETSEKQPSYLLAGEDGNYIKLSPSAYHLVRSVHLGCSFDTIAEKLSQQQAKDITPEDVEIAYQTVISNIEQVWNDKGSHLAAFRFRFRLIPASVVVPISRYLSFFFHPLIACLILGLTLPIIYIYIATFGVVANISTPAFWVGYLLFLVSLAFHEFGHASACMRYGAKPSDIGFALYLIFPIFYSDVSNAWVLKRWQRVVVDFGGVFFQLAIGACYAVLFLIFHWSPFATAFAMIIYSCLFALNPILKFDGYWILADALGVTNLSQQTRRIWGYFSDTVRGRATTTLPWSKSIIAFLCFYTILSVGFWAYLISRISSSLWHQMLNFPYVTLAFAQAIYNQSALLGRYAHSFLVSTLILLITSMILTRILKTFLKPVYAYILQQAQKWRNSH